jgi:hypothetical protein
MPSHDEIEAILDLQVREAEKRFLSACAAVNQILQEPPGSIPAPDGVHRVHLAIQEESTAREHLKRATLRQLEFRVNGVVPDDLKGTSASAAG